MLRDLRKIIKIITQNTKPTEENLHSIKSILDQDSELAYAKHIYGNGRTLLHYAAELGHLEVLKLLLDLRAPVNDMDYKGYTPLHYVLQLRCSYRGWKEEATLLLKRGADVNTKLKHDNERDLIKSSQYEDMTPLHFVARSDTNAERVIFLLKNGALVNEPDKEDRTPLHYAAQNGMEEAIKVLLKNGATIDAVDKDGSTPLHYAATERRTKAVKLLLQEGARPDIQDRYGRTPLHKAISSGSGRFLRGHQDLIDNLVERAPKSVHLRNKWGGTPFECARGAASKYKFEYIQNAVAKAESNKAKVNNAEVNNGLSNLKIEQEAEKTNSRCTMS